jgi:hypothetical protein
MVSEAPAQHCCKAQWLGSNPGFEQAGENLVDADFEVMNDDKKNLRRISEFAPLLAVQSFAATAFVQVKPYIKSKRRVQRTYGNQCETSR